MKCFPVLFFVALSTSIIPVSFAQVEHSFLVKKVNLKGLPIENDFSCLQQDDDGFLWMGGLSGLYRYDGLRISRFLRDPADTNSLTHNYASSLTKDRKGNIWIGTFGGFMNMFDRNSGKIKRIEPAILNDERKVVRKTKAASDGNIIAATANGFFKIDPRGTVIDSVMMSLSIHLANVSITDFLEYENDKLLITSTTGLFLLDWKNRSIVPVPFLPAQKVVRCIEEDNQGNFWIGMDSMLMIVDKGFGVVRRGDDSPLQLRDNPINCIEKDATGRMWIGTGEGLFVGDLKGVQKINMGSTDSLEKINELFIDNQSTVWVCAAGKGLYQVYQPGIVFQTIPGMQAYSKHQLVQTILEEEPRSWLIGTRFGMYRYKFSSKKVEEIFISGTKNKPWIGAQLKDSRNGYWVGTFGQGVFYRAPGKNEFIQFTSQPQNEHSIPFNTIVALAEDVHGNIWMGSYNSGNQANRNSLCYYDPITKIIYQVPGKSDAKTFISVAISQIETNKQDHIWIGTWDGGIYNYKGKGTGSQQNTFTNYNETSNNAPKTSHNVVSCIRPARNGKIWFGTISGGLNMLDTKSNSITWFTVKDGLPSNLIYRIEEDDQGMLWISTDNGISRLDPSTMSFINYNTTAGLPSNNFAFLTSLKCSDGTIAFGTNDGQVVYFNPNSFKNASNDQKAMITDVRIFNKSIETGPTSLLKRVAYLTDTIHLDHDHSVISFDLSNMDYLNPEIYTYAYKLENFDKEWTYITDRNSITYTNLDPGTYTLLVKNANHLGTWNENPTKLVLIIKPPYWQRWWFISLAILVLAAIIYTLFRYRLQQKLRVLQVRNRLHRDLHDDVGATLSSVKAYSEILKTNPNNPVIAELISNNSTEMLDRLEVIAWATNPHHDNFKSLKNQIIKFGTPLCHSKNIEFEVGSKDINEEVMMPGEIRQNVFLVFKEALNNMIKYSDASTCRTEMIVAKNQFILKVIDNGKGFDGIIKGSGNGWKNMHKRTDYLNGKLTIDSEPGKGTKIILSIPYPFKIPSSWDLKEQDH